MDFLKLSDFYFKEHPSFQSKISATSEKSSFETFTEKTPAVTEKINIEHGHESKSLAKIEHSDYQNSERRLSMNSFLIEHYLTCFKFSIQNLLEETKTCSHSEL